MEITDYEIPEFSLFGGPLHRFGARLGLVRYGTNTFWLGVALGLFSWAILMFAASLYGSFQNMLSLKFIGAHIRLLVAIPLLFLGETVVGSRMTAFVSSIIKTGLVPESEVPKLAVQIRRVGRLKDFWLMELIFILIAFIFPLFEKILSIPGGTSNLLGILAHSGDRITLTNIWYLVFCLPLFRFLILRWVWHLVLWWYFLWQLKNLKLHLIPTHPDTAAGLGGLEVVQEHFIPLVIAIAAVFSAAFAEGISGATMMFEDLYIMVPLLVLVIALLFIGPLFIFAHKLWVSRVTGLNEYMMMAYNYVDAFDRKWIRDKTATGEKQLGTPDMQSLADLTNSVNVVRGTRWIPASKRLFLEFAIAFIFPLLPLLLLKFHITVLMAHLFHMFAG